MHYVDVRGALTNHLTGQKCKDAWRDEMHATKAGYRAITDLITTKIEEVSPTVP